MPASELITLTSDSFLAFSTSAITVMPASTVNNIPIAMLKLATNTQLSAFLNSPYYNSYDSSIKSYLSSLTSEKSSTLSTSSSLSMPKAFRVETASLIFCLAAGYLLTLKDI